MALIQHWKCQDNAASTTVVATVGTNGTLEGGDNTSAKSTVDGPGTAYPRSFQLNGTDDAIDVSGASLSFASGAAFTLCGWMKFQGLTDYLFGIVGASNNRFGKQSDTLLRLGTSTNSDFTFVAIGTGTWRHILVSKTAGNSVRCFLDGVESSTGALTNANTIAPTRLGRMNTDFYAGLLTDVRVYDSDEAANVAAIMAEKDTAGGLAMPIVMHHRKLMMGY